MREDGRNGGSAPRINNSFSNALLSSAVAMSSIAAAPSLQSIRDEAVSSDDPAEARSARTIQCQMYR
jgi:hypothetical protein